MFDQPRVGVIGCGYLGATTAICLASMGFQVTGLDVSQERVSILMAGRSPFYEPGLQELLGEGLATGRLSFTTDYARLAEASDVVFLCVGTPQLHGEMHADLSQVDGALDALLPLVSNPIVVVGKSTVPVGTAARLRDRLKAEAPAGAASELVWNPEFLQEGLAIDNTLRPDRIVIGSAPEDDQGPAAVRRIFRDQELAGIPFVETDLQTAELVKISANAFLATKISFINAMSEVCDAAGADVLLLAEALGHDARIGPRFLRPGLGFGGGCLPKDIRALQARAGEIGAPHAVVFLSEIDAINRRCRDRVVNQTQALLNDELLGARVAVLGAAFKPTTDDIRDSPALDVAGRLHLLGAEVIVYDPEAMPNAAKHSPTLAYAESALAACEQADVVLVLTEWDEFVALDPSTVAEVVRQRIVIDARHALDRDAWRAAGWLYWAPGTPLR